MKGNPTESEGVTGNDWDLREMVEGPQKPSQTRESRTVFELEPGDLKRKPLEFTFVVEGQVDAFAAGGKLLHLKVKSVASSDGGRQGEAVVQREHLERFLAKVPSGRNPSMDCTIRNMAYRK